MIAITHDLSILAQIADSILVMYAGRLAEKASTGTIVKAPLHPYTQMLLASLPEVGVRHDQATLTGIAGARRRSPARRQAVASPIAARSPGRNAPRRPRSKRCSPVTMSPAGK